MNYLRNKLHSDNERSSLLKKNIAFGLVIKGFSIIISLLLIPMTISYVSSELYGVWLTLTTLIQWIGFFDVGFGNGLRNRLTEAIAQNNYDRGKILVSSTYFILSCIFITIAIITFLIAPFIPWSTILNVSAETNPTLVVVVRIVLISFCVQMIVKVIQNVTQAYQLNSLSSAIDTFSNFLILVTVFVLSKTTFPDLRFLALVFSATPVIVLVLYSILLYSSKFKDVRPNLRKVKKKAMLDVFQLGSNFFIIQIVCLVLFQSINFVITQIAGPESVTIYNVAYKYVGIPFMVFQIVLAPVWSAFTDAKTKKDYVWMDSIYKRLLKLFFICMGGVFIMIAISPLAYKLWLGDSVEIPMHITALVGVYAILNIFSALQAQIINGVGTVRIQIIVACVQAITYIPLSICLGKIMGLSGTVLALIAVMLFSCVTLRIQVRKILDNNAVGIWAK